MFVCGRIPGLKDMAVLIWWHFLCSQLPGVCERSNGLHGANARGVDWKSNLKAMAL